MFAREGATVVVTDLRAAAAEEVANGITNAGGRAIALAIDVGEESALQRMVDTTIAEYGRIDVLYNNSLLVSTDLAMRDMDIIKFDPEVFYATLRVNVVGGVPDTKLAAAHKIGRANVCTPGTNAHIV